MLRQSTKKKKKKKEAINNTQIRRRCMRHLIRTYMVWELISCYCNQQKKKKEAINNTQIRRRCMRHLIRTYTVWELIYQIWDRQTVLIKTNKKRKKTGAFKRCILLSLSVKRPLTFWTRRLHLDVLQSQCIHTCHTNGLIIRLPLLMIRVNCLFTAKVSEVLIF